MTRPRCKCGYRTPTRIKNESIYWLCPKCGHLNELRGFDLQKWILQKVKK